MLRIGQGFDVHRFGDAAGPITIGGVSVPSERCLVAHSDGDVLLHALCDAILGAACLGDIGHLYPDNDDHFLGIDSRILLRDVVSRIKDKGWRVSNADMTIIAQVPKMAPYEAKMRQTIASDLGISPDCISVKATTTEKLGFPGRGEGIACEAVCLIESI